MKPLVAIIMVVWNGVDDTLDCLRSLADDPYENKVLILVDNGSTDGSAQKVRAFWPDAQIVSTGRNLGFTGGNNVGLVEAFRIGARYAFLLNNDTTVEAEALTALVDAAERDPGAGILAPVVHYHDSPGSIWFSGAVLRLGRGEAVHDHTRQPERSAAPYASPWVSGCAMLVRMVAVDQVGGFDDRFYLTWEDVDWCVRMRSEGWGVFVVPAARIFHKCSRATRRITGIRCYYAVRNSLLMAQKHAGLGYWTAIVCVVISHARALRRETVTERRESIRTAWQGLRDHWRGRYGPRPV
ncbi:MAG: hypothetical protein RLZZ399_562 [Verrucomicrobiota bacterium]|jgi:GT2 family glycosyltransferase